MTRGRWACAGALLGILAGACHAFPELELGRCGNDIIESGEDCDDRDPEHCSSCYLVCSPGVSTTGCPDDRVCGVDGRCRAASGRFALDAIRIVHAGAQWLEVGDLDGDGRADVLVQLDTELDVVHLAPQQTVDLGRGLGRAAIGDLDRDGRDEVLFAHVAHALDPDARGLSLLRELARDDDTRVAAADTLATLRSSGTVGRLLRVAPVPDRVLELVQPQASFAWHRGTAEAVALMPAMPIDPAALGRALPAATLDLGAAPCSDAAGDFARPSVVVAESGASALRLFASCGGALPFELDVGATVTLPAGATLGAAGSFLVDVDGDGGLDVITQSDSGAVWVAYGAADGSFGDTAAGPGPGNGAFDPVPLFQPEQAQTALLSVAQLDGDTAPELVTSEGFVADPTSCAQGCSAPWSQPLREAVVLDFDDDGVGDLVALEPGALTLRLGARDDDAVSFTPPHVLAALDDADTLVVGDFDHDTVDDVAVIERADTARVRLLYGGDAEPWQSTEHGPFFAVQSLAVDGDGTVLARTLDASGRAAGAFIRAGETAADLGHALRGLTLVRTSAATVAVALVPDGEQERLLQLGFVDGALSPHDVVLDATIPGMLADGGTQALVAAIELDGDAAQQELVLLGNVAGGGAIWTASWSASAATWQLDGPRALGPGFARAQLEDGTEPPGEGPDGTRPGSSLAVADADGDGDDDVLATTDERVPRVVLIPGEHGRLAPEHAQFLTDATHFGAFEVAMLRAWRAHDTAPTQWLVAGDDGVGLATLDLERHRFTIDDVSAAHTEALATGDVDGDGLLDLIFATEQELRIHLALEARGPG